MSRPTLRGQRYSITRPLGEGAQGSVWLATDGAAGGREVAIKLLAAGSARPDSLRREFSLLSRLRHPGLAAILDLGEAADGAPFLVMDYIDGPAISRWWRDRDPAQVLALVARLLGALDFLHRRQVVHRDVKPDNVLICHGAPRLVDFGLAAHLGASQEVSGTPGYLAPELLAGDPPSPASDLYPVGLMLYEFFWGRLPFSGTTEEVTRAQLRRDVEIPERSDRGPISADLRSVLERLLARLPTRRIATAAGALDLFEELGSEGPGPASRYLVGQGLPAPVFAGRADLLEQADRALDDLQGGDHGAAGMLILGQPGEGRSRLCEEISFLAHLKGLGVIPGTRAPGGEGLGVGAAAAAEPEAEGARAVGLAVDRLRALTDGPRLLVADDVEDPLEVRILLALGKLELPLFICAAARTGSRAAASLSAELETVTLAPLGERDVVELVGSMLPASWSSADLAEEVYRASGGNPLLITELTRISVAVGAARGGRPDLARAMASSDVETRIRTMSRLRVESLSTAEQRAAAAAALFEAGVPADVLSSLEPSADEQILGRLLMQNILQETADRRLRVTARAMGQALLQDLPPQDRERLAGGALRLLELDLWSAPERAQLVIACGAGADHVELLLRGARQARRSLELGQSARLFEAACSHLDFPGLSAVSVELAQVYMARGQHAAAQERLEEVAGRAPEPGRTELLCAAADARLKSGDVSGGLAVIEGISPDPDAARDRVDVLRGKLLLFAGRYDESRGAVESTSGSADPLTRGEAWHVAGLCRYYQGDLERALEDLERAGAAVAATGDLLARARVTNSQALVHQRRSSFDEARGCYQQCLRWAREAGHLPFEATFLMNLGSVAQQLGDPAAAMDQYRESLRVARRFGGARESAQVQHNLGRLLSQIGQESSADRYLRRSSKLCRSMGWRSLEAHNLVVLGEAALERGEPDRARDELDRAAAIFTGEGDLAGAAEARLARARGLLMEGDPSGARRLAREVRDDAVEIDTLQLRAELLLGRIELTLPGGSPAKAIERLRRALRLAEDSHEHDRMIELHHLLARAHRRLEDVAAAELHRQTSLRYLDQQRDRLPAELRRAFAAMPVQAAALEDTPDARPRDRAGVGANAEALLAALLEINKELNREPDLRRLLERIIDHAVDLLGAERGFLLLSTLSPRGGDPGDTPYQIQVARNIDQETIRRKGFKISRSVAEEVLQTGRPLMTVNAMEDGRFQDFLSVHDMRLRSIICVPMTIQRRVRGAIYLDNRFRDQAFTDAHQNLLSALADQAALAVGSWELIEQNRQRRRELEHSQQELQDVNLRLKEAMAQQSLELDALARLTRSQQGELVGRYQFDNLIGQSVVMRELFGVMERVKDSEAPVFIHGESGTGKELVARAMHYNGARREQPFVSVNCGAIPATLLESEMFGYEKGSFTGAERRHAGFFERSDGGTLFLDEVGDTPAALQVKLLRVLQEKRFTRIGGEAELGSDFRLLTASNKDIGEMVQVGGFREDLYYRINVIQLRLPPVRERRDDIPLLVQHLLRRHGGEQIHLSRAALDLLMDHDWPGNVRELENEILRLLALGGELIQPEDLSPRMRRGPGAGRSLPRAGTLKEAAAQLEREMVAAALQESASSVTAAARRLGLSRVGLHKMMRRHGIRRS